MDAVLRQRRRRHHHHHIHSIRLSLFTFLLFTSGSSAVTAQTQLGGVQQQHQRQQHREEHQSQSGSAASTLDRVVSQKFRLVGPGSSPPSCRSKCGRCSPCKAVHVPIQPGVSMPLEYYPEAWRCKCGNKLFMP